MKYIVVTGGVISGIGKGITASSIGLLLRQSGFHISAIKIDPYLNLDAGTMSPFEHGECYVLDDGGETDLDLGNYERFLGIHLTNKHNITTGKIYKKVIDDEREGKFLGKTVQVVPHLTNEIKSWIETTSQIPVEGSHVPDICLIELGGTIGDIESMPFVEALRQFAFEKQGDVCFLHVSLLPLINSGELKTKPTQHSIKELKSLGIVPDFLCLRTCKPVSDEIISKISTSCQIRRDDIIINENISHIYQVPLLFEGQGVHEKILDKLGLRSVECRMGHWNQLSSHFGVTGPCATRGKTYNIEIVGKYTGLTDSYLSLMRSLEYASFQCNISVSIRFTDAENIDWSKLQKAHGIVIAGGFGPRGIQGKIDCCKYARETKVPLLGICLGVQVIAIEFARNVLQLEDANSTEFDATTKNPVVSDMPEYNVEKKGGTMRLGAKTVHIDKNKSSIYSCDNIEERHRHRYEINPEFYDRFENNGLRITGRSHDDKFAEVVEYNKHPFYVGCQFHPEYSFPNPIFKAFLSKFI
mgnify:CR=1 FL=1